MKILVPVKRIAAPDEDFELTDNARGVDPDYLDYELNEWDEYSYEAALLLAEQGDGVEVVPMTVGPENDEEALRKCLAKGGERGIRVHSDALAGSAPNVIGRVIARVAQKENADLVLCGALSADHGFAQTGLAAAAELGWAHVAVVSHLERAADGGLSLRRELEGGLEEERGIRTPAVLTIQVGINSPRYASLRGVKLAKAKPVEVLSHTDLGLDDAEVGEAASCYRVRKLFAPPKGQAELLAGTPAEQAAAIAQFIREQREAPA